ncbi:hypothetical protein KRC07_004782 [Salmonella enterica]|uniref:Uncharacterized protein n=2 Tax=Salmonella enterica TaxID=28901 RepID=A0A765NNQ5_SALER|nr:hypothetical protein [Salmonella enterica]EBV5224945.1 hypothetical protein [Salmonella enterica subsp. enterica serovar Litchfield]ECH6870022.1 hypothetical protein [Salmonella enterica subsp. enterica serovar Typhimurium]ECM7289572.1 hypothetical protein [Salmonella enterica subsp. enterica serovar Enteritidis]EDS8372687.1 hypothetical protein [Salmonella enterica subsp. enterica serovar Bovismorbificans]EKR1744976.1 hypothetical protein [Salmonella enterica subsp. enterica serovar 4,[5],
MIGLGKNTVLINGEPKHITDLSPVELCNEWLKLKNENADLYSYNRQVNRGWRGFILRLIGVNLADKNQIKLGGINARKESVYPE